MSTALVELRRALFDVMERVAAMLRVVRIPATVADVAFLYGLVLFGALLGLVATA